MTKAWLLSCVMLSACSTAKPEAASLVASVERFHRASNDERPARADDVSKVMCEAPDVCDVKSLCVAAMTATAKALRLKHEAETALADLEAGRRQQSDPEIQALPGKLDDATNLLKEGHDKMPACDQNVLILRERYGL
jgi:hypothetical protein